MRIALYERWMKKRKHSSILALDLEAYTGVFTLSEHAILAYDV